MNYDYEQVKLLAKLFESSKEDEESDSDNEDYKNKASTSRSIGPGDIANVIQNEHEEIEPEGFNNEEEIINVLKLKPDVSYSYVQNIRPEDLFLQLGLRTPSTASCEQLKIIVEMPEEENDLSEIDANIDTNKNCLVVKSSKYYLNLKIPDPIDKNESNHNAKWDPDKKQLIITVLLSRELDCTNF